MPICDIIYKLYTESWCLCICCIVYGTDQFFFFFLHITYAVCMNLLLCKNCVVYLLWSIFKMLSFEKFHTMLNFISLYNHLESWNFMYRYVFPKSLHCFFWVLFFLCLLFMLCLCVEKKKKTFGNLFWVFLIYLFTTW